MLLNIILIVILLSAVAVIAVIVFRKLPVLRTLDVSTVPEAQTARVRDRILLERIKRQTKFGEKIMKERAAPVFAKLFGLVKKLFKKIYELEQKYQQQAFSKTSLSPAEMNSKLKGLFEETYGLLKSDRYSEAEKFLIEIVSLDPKNIEAYELLASVYSHLKEFKQELEIRQFIVKLKTKTAKVIVKETESGQKVKTLDNAHSVAESYFDVGGVYQKLDKFDQSLINYQRALELEPNNPKFLDNTIELSIQLKNKDLGWTLFKRLEETNPDNQKLREYREILKFL